MPPVVVDTWSPRQGKTECAAFKRAQESVRVWVELLTGAGPEQTRFRKSYWASP